MLTFDEIEDCLPDEVAFSYDEDGRIIVSAQWLHAFAQAVAKKEREKAADQERKAG